MFRRSLLLAYSTYVEDFTIKQLLLFEICACEKCEKFVYKHSETIEYVKKLAYFLRNLQTFPINNSRVLKIKNAKFPGYSFYINTNLWLARFSNPYYCTFKFVFSFISWVFDLYNLSYNTH